MTVTIPSTPYNLPTTQLLPPTLILTQGGSNYTFALTDAQCWIRFNNVAGCSVVLPQGVFPFTNNGGTLLTCEAATGGLVTVSAAGGVTILPASPIAFLGQSSVIGFMQVAQDVWNAFGAIA